MSKPPDIIAIVLARVRVCAFADIAALESDLGRIETEMRQEYGGDCHRVYCRPPDLDDKIAQDLGQGDSVGKIAKKYGISRATVYRARLK